MRVFMPDCAFQAQVPADQRQYLGNWSASSTADVYTREKRNVVCKLWLEVCSKLPTLQVDGSREARVDLSHPDYGTPESRVQQVSTPDRSSHNSPSSWMVCEPASTSPLPTGTVGPERAGEGAPSTPPRSTTTALEQAARDNDVVDRLAADLVLPPKGPLTLVSRTSGPHNKGARPVHLLTPEGKGIGCGWKPSWDKIRMLNEDDIRAEPALYTECSKCFRFFTWPSTWTLQTPTSTAVESSSSSSSGSLTHSSVDTLSDLEGVVMD